MSVNPIQNRNSHRFYLLFAALCIFIFGHNLYYSSQFLAIQDQSGSGVADLVEGGNTVRQISLVILGCGSLAGLYMVCSFANLTRDLRNNLVYLFFLLIAFSSVLWADEPSLAFRRSVEFLLISISSFTLASLTDEEMLLRFAFWTSLTFVGIGLMMELVLGQFRPTVEDYRFCGTLHPNHQAWQCSLLMLSASAIASRTDLPKKQWYVLCGFLGFVCLLLTKSRTALGAALASLVILLSLGLPKVGRTRLFQYGLASALMVLSVAIFWISSIGDIYKAQLAGRGEDSVATLTGRIPLWGMAIDFIAKRPILGYGYYSFWTADHIRYFSDELGWGVPESHNGYIELLLSLGIVGLVLYLTIVGRILVRYYRRARQLRTGTSAFPVALIIFFLLIMLCDTIALDINIVTAIIFAYGWRAGNLLLGKKAIYEGDLESRLRYPDNRSRAPLAGH